MVALQFKTPILGVALAASTHALSDVSSPQNLWPYFIVPIPLPYHMSTILFSLTSVLHFGYDIGLHSSILLHATTYLMSNINFDLACTMMCVYYIFVHCPLQLRRVYYSSIKLFAMIVVSFALILPFTMRLKPDMYINEWMQRLVVAHVIVTLLSGAKPNLLQK